VPPEVDEVPLDEASLRGVWLEVRLGHRYRSFISVDTGEGRTGTGGIEDAGRQSSLAEGAIQESASRCADEPGDHLISHDRNVGNAIIFIGFQLVTTFSHFLAEVYTPRQGCQQNIFHDSSPRRAALGR
jgi:hypothetical protein